MKLIFSLLCLVLFASLLSATNVYDLRLILHKNDTVEFISIEAINGEPDPFLDRDIGTYQFKISSEDGSSLGIYGFNIGFVSHIDVDPTANLSDVQQFIPRNQSEGHWYLPYFENAALIQLFHEDKKIWEYNVEYLNEIETEEPPAEPTPPPEEGGPSSPSTFIYLAGVAVILAILVIFLWVKNKKRG